jgi:hypothetical protein
MTSYNFGHAITTGLHRINQCRLVTAIDHHGLDKRPHADQSVQQRDPTDMVLHVRRGDLDAEQPPIAIDRDMPLSANTP